MTSHTHTHDHAHPHADIDDPKLGSKVRIERLANFLEAHFSDVELHMPGAGEEEEGDGPALVIALDEATVRVDLLTLVSFVSLLELYRY